MSDHAQPTQNRLTGNPAPMSSQHSFTHSPLHSTRSITRIAPAPIDINQVHIAAPSVHIHTTPTHSAAIPPQFIDTRASNANGAAAHSSVLHNRQNSTSHIKQYSTELYTQQLTHYKLVDDKRNVPANSADEPIHVILPNKRILIGQVSKAVASNSNDTAVQQRTNVTRTNASDIVMYFNFNKFELPPSVQHKYNVYCVLTALLLVADLALVSALYFSAAFFDPNLAQSYSGNDALMYAINILCLTLCAVGLILRDERMLTVFNMCYYTAALISLLRVYSFVQYSHFILQLAVCHTARVCRVTAAPVWTTPL